MRRLKVKEVLNFKRGVLVIALHLLIICNII